MHYQWNPALGITPGCPQGQPGLLFSMAEHPDYQNRGFRFYEDAFLFDGYSHWFRSQEKLSDLGSSECFTVSLAFLPLTYSAHGDGLFSCYSPEDHQGLEILLERGGRITVRGTRVEFSSLRAHARAGMWNIVTVIYRGYAGWCDLYVNGVFSNRKQFPRHTDLTFPDRPLYIGRRKDEAHCREELPFGCFYGYMRWFRLSQEAASEAEILELHRQTYTGEQLPEAFAAGMPDPELYRADRNRPAYHMIASGKWMNEPHGPLYYKGWYHLFYQQNPHAPIWDHLCWGHVRSRDMIHWQHDVPALIPEKESVAPSGCWSGSALVDREGLPRIYFTAGDDDQFPNQAVALARPEDPEDEALTRWFSEPHPVQTQDLGWMGEFRDPFVWLEKDTYFMLVGSGDAENGGGNAILYRSTDGLHWENRGFILDYDFEKTPETGHVWELPILLPLRDETGEVVCHMLMFCGCQIEGDIVENYYFLGHWDPEACTFTSHQERARLLDLGRGAFTGPSGLVTPDGRSVIFTIAQGKRSFPDQLRAGWAHNGGLPVEVSIRKGDVHVQPVQEVLSLREELLYGDWDGESNHKNSTSSLSSIHGDQLFLQYTAQGDSASVILRYGQRFYEIFAHRGQKKVWITDETDRIISRFREGVDEVDLGEEPIHFDCYLDRSMLEVYINGRIALTLRNYTEQERCFEVKGQILDLKLWKMRGI